MWVSIVKLLLETMKSSTVQNILAAIVGSVVDEATHAQVKASVEAGAAQTDPAHVAASVVNAIVPGLTTWTTAELAAAESEWAAAQPADSVTPVSAFSAGVTWAIGHQTTTLTSGIAKAVAESGVSPNTVANVMGDVVQIGEAAAAGNDAAAVTEAAGDVVKAVQDLKGEEPADKPPITSVK